MIITETPKLQQLKKILIRYLVLCHIHEKRRFPFHKEKSLFFTMECEEIQRLIRQIDNELNTQIQ